MLGRNVENVIRICCFRSKSVAVWWMPSWLKRAFLTPTWSMIYFAFFFACNACLKVCLLLINARYGYRKNEDYEALIPIYITKISFNILVVYFVTRVFFYEIHWCLSSGRKTSTAAECRQEYSKWLYFSVLLRRFIDLPFKLNAQFSSLFVLYAIIKHSIDLYGFYSNKFIHSL